MLDAKLVELWDVEAKGLVVGVSPSELEVRVEETLDERGGMERGVWVLYSGVEYPLSERGMKNFIKITGISKRLLKELPLPQLIEDIHAQLRRVSIVDLIIVDKCIVSIFNSEKSSYNSYGSIISSVQDVCEFTGGNAITNDSIMVFTSLLEKDELQCGPCFTLSSTPVTQNSVVFGVFDNSRELFWRNLSILNTKLGKSVVSNTCSEIVGLLRSGMGEAIQREQRFLSNLKSIEIQHIAHLEKLVEGLKSKKIIKYVTDIYSGVEVVDSLLEKLHITKVQTLEDVFYLLMFLANSAPNVKIRNSHCDKFFRWAESVINLLVKS